MSIAVEYKESRATTFLTKRNIIIFSLLMVVLMLVFIKSADAGTGGTEFDGVWDTLKDWIQGTLGRIVAGSIILVGIIAGVVRQSLMAFAIGIAGGMGLYNSPGIIAAIMSATLNSTVVPATIYLSNGLI